jgi:hypothetical protein
MDAARRLPLAHYPPQPEATRLRLHGGPLDGWEVGVEGPAPAGVRVHGPRHGDHTVWVTHTYVERDGRYEYAATERAYVGTPSWRPT